MHVCKFNLIPIVMNVKFFIENTLALYKTIVKQFVFGANAFVFMYYAPYFVVFDTFQCVTSRISLISMCYVLNIISFNKK